MAKKSKFAKVVVALGAIGVASKIAYDKYKNVKDDFLLRKRQQVLKMMLKSIMPFLKRRLSK